MKLVDLIRKVDDKQAINLTVTSRGANDREIDFYKNEFCKGKENFFFEDYAHSIVKNIFTFGKMLCIEVVDKSQKSCGHHWRVTTAGQTICKDCKKKLN